VSWGRSSNVFPQERGASLPRRRQPPPSTRHPNATPSRPWSTHDKAGEAHPRGSGGPTPRKRLPRGGHRGRHLPVQEQHRLSWQLLRLPRETTSWPATASSAGWPMCSSRFLVTRQLICGAGKVLQTPRGAVVLPEPGAPSTSGKASPPPPPAHAPSSTPATRPHADAERYRRLPRDRRATRT